MRLTNLRLPFATEIVGRRGACRLSLARRSRRLERGRSVKLPAYTLFHVEVEPAALSAGSALHLELLDSDQAPLPGEWLPREPGPLTLRIARAVFVSPDASWSRAHAAAAMGMSVRELSARLLCENGALTDIVMEQQLMRVLLGRMHAEGGLSAGLSSGDRLRSAFYDRFGMSADCLAALRWRCALSWSGVPAMQA